MAAVITTDNVGNYIQLEAEGKLDDELQRRLDAFRENAKVLAMDRSSTAMTTTAEQSSKKEVRSRLERFARNIGPVDGTSREALRRWIDGVDHAKEWCAASDKDILEMIGALLGGALATHTIAFKKQKDKDAEDLTWKDLKAEIRTHFLDNDEEEFLRATVDRTRQQAYEDTRAYAQRFLEAVRKAYTTADLAVALTQDRLIRQFISGISDTEVRKYIHLEKPKTLQEAATLSFTASRALSLAEVPASNSRHEEPMEIGYLDRKSPEVIKLQQQLDNLTAKMDQMMASLRPRSASSSTRKEARTCYQCGQKGHIKRDCKEPTLQDLRKEIAALNATLTNPPNTSTKKPKN